MQVPAARRMDNDGSSLSKPWSNFQTTTRYESESAATCPSSSETTEETKFERTVLRCTSDTIVKVYDKNAWDTKSILSKPLHTFRDATSTIGCSRLWSAVLQMQDVRDHVALLHRRNLRNACLSTSMPSLISSMTTQGASDFEVCLSRLSLHVAAPSIAFIRIEFGEPHLVFFKLPFDGSKIATILSGSCFGIQCVEEAWPSFRHQSFSNVHVSESSNEIKKHFQRDRAWYRLCQDCGRFCVGRNDDPTTTSWRNDVVRNRTPKLRMNRKRGIESENRPVHWRVRWASSSRTTCSCVSVRLCKNRRRSLIKMVDKDEVPDYYDIIKNPMYR